MLKPGSRPGACNRYATARPVVHGGLQMSLEIRSGKTYYCEYDRLFGSPRRRYVAAGEMALLCRDQAEAAARLARARSAAEREAWGRERARLDGAEAAVAGYLGAVDRAVSAALRGAGYHRPG